MLLSGAICYVLLTITMTATWVEGDTLTRKLSEKHKRINKRDAAIFIDTMPIEPLSMQEPKIIYRRVSSQKYGPPKSKYSSRSKPRLKGRYSAKKYKKHAPPQYSYPRYIKRPSKSKPTAHRPHKWSETKPIYGVPKKVAYPRYPSEPIGFGEPPPEYTSDYHRPMPTYSEQPIDSYGAPVPTSIAGAYSHPQGYSENPKLSSHFEDSDHDVYREHPSWHTAQRDEDFDNNYAFTKKRPTFSKPPMRPFERPEQDEDEHDVDSYPDVYNYKNDPYYLQKKKRPQYFTDSRLMNKPRKLPKLKPSEDEFLVGGQYAEPPARYAKFQPSAPMYDNDEDFAPLKGFEDSEVSSATISPYVNYKNSNMAFSPQNLNDAFSIVEK